jgi:hypothetical protein
VRTVGNHRRVCTVSLALAGGLIFCGALLAVGSGSARAPSYPFARPADDKGNTKAAPGGETVVAKLPRAETARTSNVALGGTGTGARSSPMKLPAASPAMPPRDGDVSLKGLNEIPHNLVWKNEPKKDDAKPKAFASFAKASEVLPWSAVAPVPFAPLPATPEPAKLAAADAATDAAALQPTTRPDTGGVTLPDRKQVQSWVKTKVTEIRGDARERPLYHFELWLEPPADVKRRLVGVAYYFSSPAIMPQSQASSDKASGFRVSAGALACADEIVVTLRFDDGRSDKITLDGCKVFG